MNRYQRDRQRQLEAIAGQAPQPELASPDGATPTECRPFRDHAVDTTQRVDCARRTPCLDYAMAMRWSAFSCENCTVREARPRDEMPTRTGSDAGTAYPDHSP